MQTINDSTQNDDIIISPDMTPNRIIGNLFSFFIQLFSFIRNMFKKIAPPTTEAPVE